MRPIQLADVEIAARVLLRVAPDARAAMLASMIDQTQLADSYRQMHGTPHPQYGCGTLMSCAGHLDLAPRPWQLDIDALDTYAAVIAALMVHLSHQNQ